jgi:phosphatidylserine/phosphatidylglycerophosphate/cardiolipin synthase-like enzyme
MRVRASKDGVTMRVIAGTHSVLLALDLDPAVRQGCLGFSIERMDLDSGDRRWLPNMLRFAADQNPRGVTTARAPLQKFRWGDYTAEPGKRYRYRAIARHEASPLELIATGVLAEKPGGFDAIGGGVIVEVRTEDNRAPHTAVFFNRGAAASNAYNSKFGDNDPDKIPAALEWLSRGLQEALLAFLARAVDSGFALHAVVYEFQKLDLLAGLKAAIDRGAKVDVVYHARKKPDVPPKTPGGKPGTDDTRDENEAAIKAAGLEGVCTPRKANPQGGITHDKYVVLLKDGQPVAVWTGSTNWTDGGIYGQLNVGHAIDDPNLAAVYERSFQMLKTDPSAQDTKKANEQNTPVPGLKRDSIKPGITPLFSPQTNLDMITLYADVCQSASLLMVSAPFALHPQILTALRSPAGNDVLRFVLADKEGSVGKKGEMQIMNRDPDFVGAAATVLKNKLNDFQGGLLEDKESFHHAGVHVHSKIIAADPLGADPVLIMGSANFSNGSTTINDSNVLVFRGDTTITDIYVADFMRMFEHYWFRYRLGVSEQKSAGVQAGGPDAGGGEPKTPSAAAAADPASAGMALKETDAWSDPYFVAGSREERDRLAFVGKA